MVTFARNRKLRAPATITPANEGDVGLNAPGGPMSKTAQCLLYASEENGGNQLFPRFAQESVMPEVPFTSIPTRILLPIDFSASSKAALEMAADLAKHFHAELHLVNVIPMFPTTTLPDVASRSGVHPGSQDICGAASGQMPCSFAARGVKSTSSVEVGNDIAGNIMEVVEREHIDMVVISTHGISGWHPLVFGSIAEKVVKLVQCPLLLLRSAKPDANGKIPGGAFHGMVVKKTRISSNLRRSKSCRTSSTLLIDEQY